VHTDSFLHLKIKGDIIARIFLPVSPFGEGNCAYENHENCRQPRAALNVSTHREKVTLDNTDFTDVAAVVMTSLRVAAASLPC
jgi:ornithine decarboxylase